MLLLRLLAVAFVLLAPRVAFAATATSTTLCLLSGSEPRTLGVYDTSGQCVSIGFLNSVAHNYALDAASTELSDTANLGRLSADQTWAGTNTFSRYPILAACTGYLYGNAGSAASCATTVPFASVIGAGALAALNSVDLSGGLVTGTLNPARLPQYATNAALKAVNTTSFPSGYAVFRQGFYTAGDGGQMVYYFSTTGCTLAQGAGNDATQIKPTTGGGCWNAEDRPTYDARLFGFQVGDNAGYSSANSTAMTNLFSLSPSTGITNASWAATSGGQATFTVGFDMSNALATGDSLVVSGMSPSGYNGTWVVVSVAPTTIVVTMVSNPGAFVSGGTGIKNIATGQDFVFPSGVIRLACTPAQYIASSGIMLRGQGPNQTTIRFDPGCSSFSSDIFRWASKQRGGSSGITWDLNTPAIPSSRVNVMVVSANSANVASFTVENSRIVNGVSRYFLIVGSAAGGNTLARLRITGNYLHLNPTAITWPIVSASWLASQATFVVTGDATSTLTTGNYFQVSGVTPSGYNGYWPIASITYNGGTGNTTIVATMAADPGAYVSGGPVGAWTYNYCIATTTVNGAGYIPDQIIDNNECNGSLIQFDGDRPFITNNNIYGFKYGTGLYSVWNPSTAAAVSAATWAASQATFTVGTDLTSLISAGDYVQIVGVSPSSYEGLWQVASINPTTIVVNMANDPGTYIAGGKAVRATGSSMHCVITGNRVHTTSYLQDVNNTTPNGYESHCIEQVVANNIFYDLGGSGIVNFSNWASYIGNYFSNMGVGVPSTVARSSAISLTRNTQGEESAHLTFSGNIVAPGGSTSSGIDIGSDDTSIGYYKSIDGGANSFGSITNYAGATNQDMRLSHVRPSALTYEKRIAKSAAAVATMNFAPLDTTSFKSWKLKCENVTPSVADTPSLRVSEDGGATWKSTGSYVYQGNKSTGSTVSGISVTTGTQYQSSDLVWKSTGARQQRFEAEFGDLSATGNKTIALTSAYQDNASGNMAYSTLAGYWGGDSNAINGIQVLMAGGNNFTGTCTLKGE